jgi:hypothetical protein
MTEPIDEKLLRLRDLLELEAEYSEHLHCEAVPALQLVREIISERARQACEEEQR